MNVNPTTWRLLTSGEADGPTHMAVDEAILEAVGVGQSLPTLRLYAWQPGCLSLGVAQAVRQADVGRLERLGFDLVRRPSGGGAILHADELTYAVIAPAHETRLHGGLLESYRRIGQALAAGLGLLGLQVDAQLPHRADAANRVRSPICFEVPSDYEITARGKKLVGSAQVRKRGAVLQHGSLPLEGDLGRVCAALAFGSEAERLAAQARLVTRATTLADALGRVVPWQTAADALADGFATAFGLVWQPGELSNEEGQRAAELRDEKYATKMWNDRL